MEVHDIVQEVMTTTITMRKKCKKAKWLSEEALQIAEKRREAKGEGEKERYTHLNAEFQRIARREKKTCQSEQAKREENDKLGNTRGLFKKIIDTKGTFHANMGTAAKSLQSCPTLCDPIDGSPAGSPAPGILQARTLGWVAISFSNA